MSGGIIIFFALLVPILITGIFYFIKKHEFVWWEFFIPIGATLLSIVIAKVIVDHTSVMFTEYWGSTVVAVYEQEPYNYWHHETCTRTYACGTDSDGNTEYCTETYDCSHQDDVGPDWWAKTNIGETIRISEKLHDELVKQFGTGKKQVDSRRNYAPRDKCVGSRGTKFEGKRVGEVSYEYKTAWGGQEETRKPYVSHHRYENRVKASDLTIFNIPLVNEKQADSLGLFKYPEMTSGWDYPTILGIDVPKNVHENFRKLNGKFGVSNELRLWVLVFKNKPMSIATYQENYWVMGNKNELVVCIGINNANQIQWAHSFSWALSATLTAEVKNAVLNLYELTVTTTEGKKTPIAMPIVKEQLAAVGIDTSAIPPAFVLPIPQANVQKVEKSDTPVLTEKTLMEYYKYLDKNLQRFERRHFEEFSYLKVEPSRTAIIITFIIALVISIGVNIWVTNNDISDEERNGYYRNGRRFY